jgi:hypothetical protein
MHNDFNFIIKKRNQIPITLNPDYHLLPESNLCSKCGLQGV